MPPRAAAREPTPLSTRRSDTPFAVDLGLLSGSKLKAHWYDPRTGLSIPAGEIDRKGHCEFHPPTSGMYQDWVLILDDASAGYKMP